MHPDFQLVLSPVSALYDAVDSARESGEICILTGRHTRISNASHMPLLQNPMSELKGKLTTKIEGCKAELVSLKGKEEHMEAASSKLNDDFNEFVRAHLVTREEAEANKK